MSVANGPEDSGPIFTYSTGIFQRLNAPELLIIGLDSRFSACMINHYGNQILEGKESFEAGAFYSGFLDGFDIYMTEGGEVARRDFAVWSDWYYEREPFPLLQCVYPTTSGVWPWDEAASDDFRENQPVLGPIPVRN